MKILLIEDDREAAAHIAEALRRQAHEVEQCHDGISGASMAHSADYAALIVDRMLPGKDGVSLVRELRADGVQTPVLMLTTMCGIADRVTGLESGADDYLSKPFASEELLARVNAITRRNGGGWPGAVIRASGIELDTVRRRVTRDGERVELQMQEYRLLEYLMRNIGRPVTRAMLLENVWELDFAPSTNLVETHMSRLRLKIGCRNGEIIRTIRGVGYEFRAK